MVAAAGCGEIEDTGEEAPSAGTAPPEPVSFQARAALPGDLFLEEGILRFQPCGEGYAQPLDDATGGRAAEAVRELGYGEGRVRAAVVLEGSRLVEVRHAAPEAAGCRELLPDADLEARGNEPFWVVRVDGSDARWITPEEPEGIAYREGTWERPGDGRWRFEARREGVDGVEYLVLELTEEGCIDSMSGARFPFAARVEHGGRRFEGCGLEGRGAFAQP